MPVVLRLALPVVVAAFVTSAQADELTACPSAQIQADLRETSGSSIDALMNAIAYMQRRYGSPHSQKRVSSDEVRMIYRSGKGAVSVSLARDGTGRVATDCYVYGRVGP